MHRSNPACRRVTSGPQENPEKAVNLGVAAHIAAASAGGARYDASMSPLQRSAIENGIWLCQSCAKLIDSDTQKYTSGLLRNWKTTAEANAATELEKVGKKQEQLFSADVELIRFYSQCSDRPAFQDEFRHEGSTGNFDRAIEDTITAINTGNLRSRDGTVLSESKGKSYLQNQDWRKTMDTIVDLLRAIRSRYKEALSRNDLYLRDTRDGTQFYAFHDRALGAWMEHTRAEIIRMFSRLCIEANLQPLQFPRERAFPNS